MISLHSICKTYGARSVLNNVNVDFPTGQVTSLIGPNGAGKTTLLMLIARLIKPDTGHIELDGQPVAELPVRSYARRVATLRQSPDFNLRLTVDELVAFGRFPHSRGVLTSEDRTAIDEAIDFLSLQPLRDCYIDELSGGQRQMAFLAMTIAQKTDYLLLDEPLNNLDMKHAVQIMRALRRLCDEQRRTVILVVHDINFAANYSDHIVAMKDGEVFCQGAVRDVVCPSHLHALYGLDFEILQTRRALVCNYFNPSPSRELA